MLNSFLTDSLTLSDVDEMIRSHLMDPMSQPVVRNITALPSTNKPCVKIIEQPAFRSLRFRYECETKGRSAGKIVGINSTAKNRTYPTIQVMNYQGPYAVVVSCVTKDAPYRPHPHNLVGRKLCKEGICRLIVNNPDMICSFTGLGIQCVKKKDIKQSLKVRESHNLDPFGTGFNNPSNIDLSVLRLCFQVFLRGLDNYFSIPLRPIVSEPIFDKKAMSDLTIMKLSHCSAPVTGGIEVILLCNRVVKEDIQIWLYEEQGSKILWESQAEFQPNDVHRQVAISFRTPRYPNENVQQPVPVFVQLRKPSENKRGEPRPFQFYPMERDPERLTHKKQKVEKRNDLQKYFQGDIFIDRTITQDHQLSIAVPRMWRQQSTRVEPAVILNNACGQEPCAITAKSFAPMDYTKNIPICVPSPTHLTPVNSPNNLTTVSSAHNQSPTQDMQQHSESLQHSPAMQHMLQQHSESSSQHSPAMQQMLQHSEMFHFPNNLTTIPSSYNHSPTQDMQQMTLQQHSESSQRFPAMQQMLQPPESSHHSVTMQQMMQLRVPSQLSPVMEDAIIEKFDSIDLDDLNINTMPNLSASLFDSVPDTTDAAYQDAADKSDP